MISNFKPKAQVTQGIDIQHPASQASEIASMIGASSFTADILAGTATFDIDSGKIVVRAGQVVSISAGTVSVQSREEFLAMYEEQAG